MGFFFLPFFPIFAMGMSAAYERDFVRIFILLAVFTFCFYKRSNAMRMDEKRDGLAGIYSGVY